MSIVEGRQTERPIPAAIRPRQEIPAPCLATTLTTAIPANRVANRHGLSCKPSDATSHDQLVYAVYQASDTTSPSGRASRSQMPDHRFVEEDVSDEMLLRSVAEGDKAAMHIMFARHRARVSHFIRRMVRNPTIVDDLVSQVFLDVWRSANRFEGRARVSTWLLSIARFKAISSLRARTLENIDQNDVLEVADAGDTPELALDRKDTQGSLRTCIDKLRPAHREVIDLYYYREKSVAEICGIIGIPQATVKSRLFYARKQLAKILVSTGFEVAAVRTDTGKRKARSSRGLHLDKPAGLSAGDDIPRPASTATG